MQIEISLELHKVIEQERRSFEETPNDILMRVIEGVRNQPVTSEEGQDWSSFGVTLPHGTEVKMTYNGKTHTGRLINGTWHVEGKVFHSPSGAARGVARSKKGKPVSLDGWKYWHVRTPESEDFVAISSLIESK